MKHENNSIQIGNNNSIKHSVIGQNNTVENRRSSDHKNRWKINLVWKLIVPIIVIVIATAICLWLGLNS